MSPAARLPLALALQSGAVLLYELLLTRLFAITLFADFAHLALALALLGIGVGAMAQHLRPTLVPDEGLERRIGWLGLLQAALILTAVLAAIRFPVLDISEVPPTTYQDRSTIKDNLLDPVWFAALLPMLAAPFAVSGLIFSGVFSRRKAEIGMLYAADLLGAAVGAVLFVPLLGWLAGPDAAFIALFASALGSLLLLRSSGSRPGTLVAGIVCGASLLATLVAIKGDLLQIREAAGYSDQKVVYTRWTPLTRLAIHRDQRGDYMLLDNTSASEILQDEERRAKVALEPTRAIVYHLFDPPAHIAIMAASAGPEVAVAQSLGFSGIDAIDIAGEIFDVVADRYPDDPVNPYLQGDTHRINADGRAAILRATEPYDVIQMVHANLWSSAGMLNSAWSPALLETTEAFETYLDHLSEDGVVSIGKGRETPGIIKAAGAALIARGVKDPWRYAAYVSGTTSVMLLRKHPWTPAERDRLVEAMKVFPHCGFILDPGAEDAEQVWKEALGGFVPMTDDHPYVDNPEMLLETWERAMRAVDSDNTTAMVALYRSIVLQCSLVLIAGLLFLGVPLVLRGRKELRVSGAATALGFTAALGYGYLSIETVLIHDLVLFVGHPTYAVTAVVLTMLLFSGAGSLWASWRPPSARVGRLLLLGVVGMGAVVAFGLVPVLYAALLWLPLVARLGIVGLSLAPLAFAMGTAFPVGMARMPAGGASVIPWAWAINGWMSVAGSLGTVLVARLYGYSWAFGLALLAYGVAFLLWPLLARVGQERG